MSDKTIDKLAGQAKHTRGPWQRIAQKYVQCVHGPEGDCIAVCNGIVAPNEANARLIAAAPEQHEMLAKVLAGFTPDPGTSDLDDEQPIHVSMTLGDYRRIQRIMWKAEGR